MKPITLTFYSYFDDNMKAFIKANFPLNAEFTFRGALDDYSDDQIREMSAREGEGLPLGLRDGSYVFMGPEKLDLLSRDIITEIQKDNSDTVFMFCTAPWKHILDFDNLVLPFRILENNALALMKKGSKLGVIQPYDETAEFEIQHWKELGVDVISRVAGSEDQDHTHLVTMAKELETDGAGVIVMDCLFFTEEHYRSVRDAVNVPVILPMTFLSSVINATYL